MLCTEPTQILTNWDKVLPALISASVLLLIFIVGKLVDNDIRKKERKVNWYTKVAIDPYVSTINKLFEDLLHSVNQAYVILKDANRIQNDSGYILTKSTCNGDFQKLKRSFEFEYILVVNSCSDQVSNNLTALMIQMEDEITNWYDQLTFTDSESEIEHIEQFIKSSKRSVFEILYKPLSNNKMLKS